MIFFNFVYCLFIDYYSQKNEETFEAKTSGALTLLYVTLVLTQI